MPEQSNWKTIGEVLKRILRDAQERQK